VSGARPGFRLAGGACAPRVALLMVGLGGAGLLSAVACRPATPATTADGKLRVCVSILPQAYFVERIGGEHVDVQVLVGPGQSPHTYEASPQQMTWLSKADLFVTLGMPLEQRLLERLSGQRRELRVADATEGLTFLLAECEHGHDHGDGHDHGAHERDPHVWLDPQRVRQMAANICRALVELDPQRRETYERNLGAFRADLDDVDARLRQRLAPYRGRAFFVFHAAYGYFAERYGLKQLAVEVAGKEPTPRELVDLVERVRESGVKAILLEPQYPRTTAEALAREVGAEVLIVDDLARDYLANLLDLADKLEHAFGGPAPRGE
jgi:zinc transport system substrate-binding protein